MRQSFLLFSILALLCFSACNSSTPPPPSDETERQQFLASAEPMPEFTTTVLEDDLASPRKQMKGVLDGVTITINYGSPSVKGRSIWNSLVPYGEVWRTGANEATRITFDQDILVADKNLPAGTYSLVTIPKANDWEVIFNEESDQWGAYEYDESKDVLRVQAQPRMQEDTLETLEFELGRNGFIIEWERLRLPVPFASAKE